MNLLALIAAGILLAGAIAGQPLRSRLARGLMGIAGAALILVGVGVLETPNLEQLVRSAVSGLGPATYAVVGVMAFLETGAGIGLIAPGELAVVLGGIAAGSGEVRLVPLIAVVWICAVAGDALSFLLGRRLGREFLITHGARVGLTRGRVEQMERYFAQHGGKTILLGRFIGFVRALAPFIAGASHMAAGRFLALTTLAAGVWAAACTLVGYVSWNSIDNAVALVKHGSLAVGVTAVIIFGVVVVLQRRQRPEADRLSS